MMGGPSRISITGTITAKVIHTSTIGIGLKAHRGNPAGRLHLGRFHRLMAMPMRTMQLFSNAALLMDRFGTWPSFHDAEVIRIELSRKPDVAISMEVYLFATSSQLDDRGYYRREQESIVTFIFRGVQELTLLDFNEQNVLQELAISRQEDGNLRVQIFASYGLNGSFLCANAEIAHVQPVELRTS